MCSNMGGRAAPAAAPQAAPAVIQQPAPAAAPAPAAQQAAAPAPAAQQAAAPAPVQARTLTRGDIPGLQRRMGQTGLEAGDPNAPTSAKIYVNTSKAFNINAYLRSGGTSIHDPSGNSQWEYLGYTTADAARAIAHIDRGMKPLPESIKLTRFVGGDALGSMLGNPRINKNNVGRIIQSLKTPAGRAKFAAALAAADYTEDAYTSTTYLQSHPAFENRQLRLNIVARKGTKAIVTNNHAENEILLGHGAKYRFTGGFRIRTTSQGVEQLEIDVEI